jgi:hypothetical protein
MDDWTGFMDAHYTTPRRPSLARRGGPSFVIVLDRIYRMLTVISSHAIETSQVFETCEVLCAAR